MDMSMEAQFDFVSIEFELLRRLHIPNHILEDFDLIDADFNAIR